MSFGLTGIYCPAHFGNFYEVAAEGELREYFSQLASWHINGIGTWINPANMCDPFSQDPLYHWAREVPVALLERKLKLLRAARDSGHKLTLCFTPNSVFIDQLNPQLAASASDHNIGPNLCPSKPEARSVIIRNAHNLFRYLSENGIQLDYVLTAMRDFGGCSCDECDPWVETFLDLLEEIAPVIRLYHPNAMVQICTWWATEDEIEIIRSFLVRKRPDWVDGINLSLGYSPEVPVVSLPDGYHQSIFLHISYGTTHSDKYGVKGAVVAPKRLETIFRQLADAPITGIQAYSEGIFEDINKFLVGHLSQSPLSDVRSLVRQYCEECLEISGSDAEIVVDCIYKLENLEDDSAGEVAQSLRSIGEICGVANNWRFVILKTRAEVGVLEALIGGPVRWDADTAGMSDSGRCEYIEFIESLVQQRKRLLEHLERRIYRVGAQVHVLGIDSDFKPWQDWKAGRRPKIDSQTGSQRMMG